MTCVARVPLLHSGANGGIASLTLRPYLMTRQRKRAGVGSATPCGLTA